MKKPAENVILTEDDMKAKRRAKADRRKATKEARKNRLAEKKTQARLKGEKSGKIVPEDKEQAQRI